MADRAVLLCLCAQVGLPTQHQRREILLGYLHKHAAECGVGSVAPELMGVTPAPAQRVTGKAAPQLPSRDIASAGSKTAAADGATTSSASSGKDIEWVAARTEGFSGSDLLELCSQAAQRVLEEHWLTHRCGPAPTACGHAWRHAHVCRRAHGRLRCLEDGHPCRMSGGLTNWSRVRVTNHPDIHGMCLLDADHPVQASVMTHRR